jgi:DNA polymerase III alpha subunit (gram-positive type)
MIAKYICFDCETSGLDFIKNNLLSVSFIILDNSLNEIDRLNLFIKYENYNINIKALEVNKIDLIKHHNNINTVNKIQAKKLLLDFLSKNKNGQNLIPIGHNVNFDINFIKNNLLTD